MPTKLMLFCFLALISPSFVKLNDEQFRRFNDHGHIDFSKNPTGKEFIMPSNAKAELQMIDLINSLRKKKGLKALIYDPKLTQAARYHAADMAIESYFQHHTYNYKNHQLKDELGTFERVGLFYKGNGYANSENCAAGNISVEKTFLQWFNSPGHYANMLNSNSTHIGIGYHYEENSTYGAYWVMDTASEN